MLHNCLVQTIQKNSVKRAINWLPLSEMINFGGPYVKTYWCTNEVFTGGDEMSLSGTVFVYLVRRSVITRRNLFKLFVRIKSPKISIATNRSGSVAGYRLISI